MKLVLHIKCAKERKIVELDKGSHFTIGRKDCNLILEDTCCSGQHALLYEGHEGELHLRDLDSRNGTLVGNQNINEITLQKEDQFRIGSTSIKILLFEPAGQPKSKNAKGQEEASSKPASKPLSNACINPDVLHGWPNNFRALEKDQLKAMVDYVDENGRKTSVRLVDILAQRKKAG